MTQILVKEIMATSIVTVPPETTLPEAHQIMLKNKIRRLPVVERDKLIGIVTLTNIQQAEPSNATSLSVWELNYLLAKLTVKSLMTSPVSIIFQDDPVKKAADMMLTGKFGGIPVMDADENLVGMITESDIFRLIAKRGID